ncbi:hypothetical protein HK100_008864 [Physocladia obscura]|uniref:Replication termination factor 2 n=1 Tax=Physocladia obscura TaxID=109957 RepID=A0AAD5XFD2_9FUNG|nr:hypothetical protein HK100_008864 [Physocladia obscura]
MATKKLTVVMAESSVSTASTPASLHALASVSASSLSLSSPLTFAIPPPPSSSRRPINSVASKRKQVISSGSVSVSVDDLLSASFGTSFTDAPSVPSTPPTTTPSSIAVLKSPLNPFPSTSSPSMLSSVASLVSHVPLAVISENVNIAITTTSTSTIDEIPTISAIPETATTSLTIPLTAIEEPDNGNNIDFDDCKTAETTVEFSTDIAPVQFTPVSKTERATTKTTTRIALVVDMQEFLGNNSREDNGSEGGMGSLLDLALRDVQKKRMETQEDILKELETIDLGIKGELESSDGVVDDDDSSSSGSETLSESESDTDSVNIMATVDIATRAAEEGGFFVVSAENGGIRNETGTGVKMGNDGGSIPKRHELVRLKAAGEKADLVAQSDAVWTTCGLAKTPLTSPVVVCGLGRLFNKESVLRFLVDRTAFGDGGEAAAGHVRRLADVQDLALVPATNSTSATPPQSTPAALAALKGKGSGPPWLCPVTLKEFGAPGVPSHRRPPVSAMRPCGCVIANAALAVLKDSENLCLACSRVVSSIIPINPSDPGVISELAAAVKAANDIDDAKKASKKSVKDAKKDKKRKLKNHIGTDGKEDREEDESVTKKHHSAPFSSARANIGITLPKGLEDLVSSETLAKGQSDAIKSLYAKDPSKPKGNFLTMGTFNRYTSF